MLGLLSLVSAAPASTDQMAMFQENGHLMADPAGTLQQLRGLGVGLIRLDVAWNSIALDPRSHTAPKGFNAANPAAYPAGKWGIFDAIVRDAQVYGIQLDFLLTGGAPLWATGRGEPSGGPPDWRPSPSQYGSFVRAIATRYDGTYTPTGSSTALPRVSFWELWNEPNFGPSLAPQAVDGSRVAVSPNEYRQLLDYGWSALNATGHGSDTIIIGSLAPRGNSGGPSPQFPQGFPGDFSTTKPLIFTRYLYCVDSSYRELRGSAAKAIGCPTTAAASRRFRADNPGLFAASGFAIHPYPFNTPPTEPFERDPNDIEFNRISAFERALDRLTRIYGSSRRLSIYNTEYGYITDPPNNTLVNKSGHIGHYVSPTTAARYINWAEYVSWRNSRMKTTMQYLLQDGNPRSTGFDTGLTFYHGGGHKTTYNAYRMPIFLPTTSAKHGRSLLVWGAARPAHYAALDTGKPQSVVIQFRRGSRGRFAALKTVQISNVRGYFTANVSFPASGQVRLAWQYPSGDSLFPSSVQGLTVYSRMVGVTIH